jgi:AbrB family looped-hinge helix DNA binding protein
MEAHVREKGQFTIPAGIRRTVGLEHGGRVDVALSGDCIVLRPLGRDGNDNGGHPADADDEIEEATDAAFLSNEWKERIDRSIAELDEGLGRIFTSDEEFLASLDNRK